MKLFKLGILPALFALSACQPFDVQKLSTEGRFSTPALSVTETSDQISVSVTGDMVEFVDFYLGAELTPRHTATSAPYQFTMSFGGLDPGEYDLRVIIGIRALGEISSIIRYVPFTVSETGQASPQADCDQVGQGAFFGCYYIGKDFEELAFTKTDSAINFNFGQGSPDPRLPNDNFSVLWRGDFNFASSGSYQFSARVDDGIRIYVDGQMVMDEWRNQPATDFTAAVELTAGTHRIEVEYYESHASAEVSVAWSQSDGSTPPDDDPPIPMPLVASFYVATNGSDSNSGSINAPFRTLQKAADSVSPGDLVYIRGGTYPINVSINRSGTSQSPITFESYPGEWAIFDGSGQTPGQSTHRFRVAGASWNVIRNIEVRNGPQEGVTITDGTRNTVFENVISHGHYYSGFQSIGSSGYNTYLRVVSYGNYDPGNGGDHADGMNFQDAGHNIIRNCLLFRNSDDGMDMWNSANNLIQNCVAHNNGYGTRGNGEGFKMGGSSGSGGHTYIGNIAFHNKRNGFAHNEIQVTTYLYNNTAFGNGNHDYDLGHARPHVLRNNLHFGGDRPPYVGTAVDSQFNSWDLGIQNPGFISVDPMQATFLQLSSQSPARNAGTSVNLPEGLTTDLGALGYGQGIESLGLPMPLADTLN